MLKRNDALALAAAIALATSASIAFGQAPATTPAPTKTAEQKAEARAKWEATFKAADKNGDGGLSKDELAAVKGFPNIRKNFDAMDANKDGKVTIAERDAWLQAQRAAKKK
ncbi:MAG TPA: hypothetical protein VNM24_12710 [Burkholderiales bacterium]|nr:hypothetical protein [Burkholderiales bacterium]